MITRNVPIWQRQWFKRHFKALATTAWFMGKRFQELTVYEMFRGERVDDP